TSLRRDEPGCICGTLPCVGYVRRVSFRLNVMTMCVCKQDNGLPLSNATQLRARCDVLVAEEHGRVRGVASTYHDLPIPNLTFVVRSSDVAGVLIAEL